MLFRSDQAPYKNCIVLGHVQDKDGQKIPVLTNISIPSVTAADADDGSTVYNFTVSAQYYQVAQAQAAQESANQ